MSPDTEPFESLVGEAFDPAGLIEYQADSIVSRTIIDADSTTVTLFAAAAGQRISEHSAPHDALIHVLDGEAQITVNIKEHVVQGGQALVIPAGAPHALATDEGFKMLLLMTR